MGTDLINLGYDVEDIAFEDENIMCPPNSNTKGCPRKRRMKREKK